jgi:Zn-dependent metalloprotease
MEDRLAETTNSLKREISNYKTKIEESNRKAEVKVMEKLELGEITTDKASDKLNKLEKKVDIIPTRKNRVIKIIDENKIPKEY